MVIVFKNGYDKIEDKYIRKLICVMLFGNYEIEWFWEGIGFL